MVEILFSSWVILLPQSPKLHPVQANPWKHTDKQYIYIYNILFLFSILFIPRLQSPINFMELDIHTLGLDYLSQGLSEASENGSQDPTRTWKVFDTEYGKTCILCSLIKHIVFSQQPTYLKYSKLAPDNILYLLQRFSETKIWTQEPTKSFEKHPDIRWQNLKVNTGAYFKVIFFIEHIVYTEIGANQQLFEPPYTCIRLTCVTGVVWNLRCCPNLNPRTNMPLTSKLR